MVGMRKDPKVGGGVGGTYEVAKNQTQHSLRLIVDRNNSFRYLRIISTLPTQSSSYLHLMWSLSSSKRGRLKHFYEEESAKLCLMVRSDNNGNSDSHEDNDEVYSDTSSTSDDLPSYEVLYNAYVELHEELKKLARINVDKKREILRNEKKLANYKRIR
ncbi:hypothetical protein Lal_00025287 [Lupinus albus]|nr:hypothetical protein Lal_00025287 [Lupinus albus]